METIKNKQQKMKKTSVAPLFKALTGTTEAVESMLIENQGEYSKPVSQTLPLVDTVVILTFKLKPHSPVTKPQLLDT